jgi:hypothetical protein
LHESAEGTIQTLSRSDVDGFDVGFVAGGNGADGRKPSERPLRLLAGARLAVFFAVVFLDLFFAIIYPCLVVEGLADTGLLAE